VIPLPDISADWLLARVRDNGEGCLVWTGYSDKGHPKANFGPGAVIVRRVIWKTLTGQKPRADRIIKCTCGTPNCVEPAHLEQLSHGHRNIGRKQTIQARAASTRALRAKSKIKDEIEAIRSSDFTEAEEAARVGISQAMVSRIRLGKNWAPISSPFVGLGAR
jgi:hypothetical protein